MKLNNITHIPAHVLGPSWKHSLAGYAQLPVTIRILGTVALLLISAVLLAWLDTCWPLSAFLLIAAGPVLCFRNSEKPSAKALAALLTPIACGLTLLNLLLIGFNLLPQEDATIRSIERTILWLSKLPPEWLKAPWFVAPLFLVVTLISYFTPKLELVKKLKGLKTLFEVGSGTLVTVASFTFFTDQAFTGQIKGHLVAEYRDSKERADQHIAHYLALTAVRDAIASDHETARYYAHLANTISKYFPDHREELSTDVGKASIGEEKPVLDPPKLVSPRENIWSAEQDEQQHEKERKANDRVSDAIEGINKAISEAVGIVPENLFSTDRDSLFSTLLGAVAGKLTTQIKSYIGDYLKEVSNEHLDEALEPLIKNVSEHIGKQLAQFRKSSAVPSSTQTAGDISTLFKVEQTEKKGELVSKMNAEIKAIENSTRPDQASMRDELSAMPKDSFDITSQTQIQQAIRQSPDSRSRADANIPGAPEAAAGHRPPAARKTFIIRH